MLKYAALLEDKGLRRWFDNLSRGSKITARNYLRKLGNFCEANKVSPQRLLKRSDREIYNLLLDAVGALERLGRAGGHIASVLKAVKSWLSFNGREAKGKIKVRGVDETPTLQNERVPTLDELRAILLTGDLKTRAACALLAHSGVRPGVLGDYDGTDGLRVKDLPELEVRDGEIVFTRIPALIRVRASLSKKRSEYFTFLGDEGCQYLKAYLDSRLRGGEKLTAESAVITPKTAGKDFISTPNIGDAVRKAIRGAGFPWRPYVLRSYFATQMMLAESKGLVIRDYRTFFMGHKGDIEAVYTLNKRKLLPDVMEQMRESYAKSQKYLQTVESNKQEDVTKAFKRQLLLVAGLKPDEIKDEHLELGEEEFQKLVRDRLVSEVKNNGARQKVVAVGDVEAHLKEGWEFVSALPEGKAIVTLPRLD